MPCYDSRSEPKNVLADARKEWMHNSPVAEMLCSVMKEIEAGRLLEIVTPDVRAWWEDHKKRDTARAAGKE